jgi:hypothetical protein
MVRTTPETLHTPGVEDENATGKPDVALALNRGAGIDSIWSWRALNKIVCGCWIGFPITASKVPPAAVAAA